MQSHLRLPLSNYFSRLVPDATEARRQWFNDLRQAIRGSAIVFLDPDNGLQPKSCRRGRKHSSKYLLWEEVEALWKDGKSLIIYQHFIRQERNAFINRIGEDLRKHTTGSRVEAFKTAHVVFFLVLQGKHDFHDDIVRRLQSTWIGQIDHWLAGA